MNGFRLLVATACIAVIGGVALYVFRDFQRQQVEAAAAAAVEWFARCTPEERDSANAYFMYGDKAVVYGHPRAKENAAKCGLPTF